MRWAVIRAGPDPASGRTSDDGFLLDLCGGHLSSAACSRSPDATASSAALWAAVISFVGIAGEFVLMKAYFLAVVEILVYAGAIMVLFLFVIMLINLRRRGPARR